MGTVLVDFIIMSRLGLMADMNFEEIKIASEASRRRRSVGVASALA